MLLLIMMPPHFVWLLSHEIAKYLEEKGADKGAESSEWHNKFKLRSDFKSLVGKKSDR